MPAELQRRARKNSLSSEPHSSASTPAGELDAVVERRMLHDVENAAGCACARIRGPEHETTDARVDHRPGAHRTGLKRHVQRRVEEPVARERLPGRPQRDHLGVRARIVRAYRLVPAFGDDRAVVDEDGANGHLARGLGLPCKLERTAHEGLVGGLPRRFALSHARIVRCRLRLPTSAIQRCERRALFPWVVGHLDRRLRPAATQELEHRGHHQFARFGEHVMTCAVHGQQPAVRKQV